MARPRPLLLLLDWDGTLTTASTLPLLASVATPRAPHPALPALSRAYARHLAAHDRAYRPARPERTTVAQELAYLDALRPVEGASVGRVEAAGLFGGVRTRDVDAAAADAVAGRAVGVRAGAAGLLGRVQRGGGRVVVVSVAWSRRFIHGVLSGCVRREAGGEVVVMGDVEVRANEILADGSGRLDRVFGGADGGIWTAGDKGRVMEGEIAAAVGGGSSVPRTVYVGDSPTDLACLLKADVGICIRDEVMGEEQRGLRETLERVGVECLHVGAFGDDRAEDGGGGRLWWARDFEEVCRSGVIGTLTEERPGPTSPGKRAMVE